MSKTKHDFITDFIFEVNGQFHQPDYDMLDSFYDLMQREYEEKLRWIPVKEQLPKENGRYLTKSEFNSIGEWSKNAFPDANSITHIVKLKHEAQEVIESPYDIKEYADCIIALFAAAYKADIAFFELVGAVESKLEVNKNRKWTKLSDGTYQHCP